MGLRRVAGYQLQVTGYRLGSQLAVRCTIVLKWTGPSKSPVIDFKPL
jgi:hypothetical protein